MAALALAGNTGADLLSDAHRSESIALQVPLLDISARKKLTGKVVDVNKFLLRNCYF